MSEYVERFADLFPIKTTNGTKLCLCLRIRVRVSQLLHSEDQF